MASIERAGVLTPPVLLPNKDDNCIVVSGFKRIAALKQLDVKETVACVLDRHTAPGRCIEIAVIDNTAQRQLNPVEQGRVILLLDDLYTDSDALCRAAGGLGVAVNPRAAQKLRVAAQLKPYLQKALLKGAVALPVALRLAEMEDQCAAERLTELIGAMGMGLNRQRELLDWLKAISRREGIGFAALIDEDRIQVLLKDPDMDIRQKRELLRRYFRQRRFPEIVKTETRFMDTVDSLRLENGIRLDPPQHFEGQAFSLTINFTSHQQLISKYQGLEKAINSSAMASLWDIVHTL